MDPNMGGDVGEMIVKRVSVPIGLEELMEGLVKEVLLTKPDDIYIFAAKYFSQLLTHRDKSQHKVKTMRSAQSLKHQGEKRFSTKIPVQAVTKQLSRQFSIREESPNKNLESPIISQKPRMYNRNEPKNNRKNNGPQIIKENNQSLAARKQISRSVSNERSREPIGSYVRKEPKKTDSPRGPLKNKSGPKGVDIRSHITGLPVEVEAANKPNVKNGNTDGSETNISPKSNDSGEGVSSDCFRNVNESKPPMDLDVETKPETKEKLFSVDVSGISTDNSQDRKEDKTKEKSERQLSTYDTPQEQIVERSDEKSEEVDIHNGTIKTSADHEISLEGTEVVSTNEENSEENHKNETNESFPCKSSEKAMREKSDPSILEKKNEPAVPLTEEIKEDPISTKSSQSDALGQIAQEEMKEEDVQKPEDDKKQTRMDDSISSGENTHEAIEENSDLKDSKKNNPDAPKEDHTQEEMEENGLEIPKDDKNETSIDDSITPDKKAHETMEEKNGLGKNIVPDAEEIKEDPIFSNSSQSDGSGKIAPDEMKESDVQKPEDNMKEISVDDSFTPDKATDKKNDLNSLKKNYVSDAQNPEKIKQDLISSSSSQSDGPAKIAQDEMKENDVHKPEYNIEEASVDDSVSSDKNTQGTIGKENYLNSLEKNNVSDASQPGEMKEDPISSNSNQPDGSGKIAADEMKESDVQKPEDNMKEISVDDSFTPDKATDKDNDLNSLKKNNVSDAQNPEKIKQDLISSSSGQSDGSAKIAQDEMKENDVQKPEYNIEEASVDDSVISDKSIQGTIGKENYVNSLEKNNVSDASQPEEMKEDPISSHSNQPDGSGNIAPDEMKESDVQKPKDNIKHISVDDSVTPNKSTHEDMEKGNNLAKNNVSDASHPEEIKEDALGTLAQQEMKEKGVQKPEDDKVETSRNESGNTNELAQEEKSMETDLNSLGKDNLSNFSTIEGINEDDIPTNTDATENLGAINEKNEETHINKEKINTEPQTLGNNISLNSKEEIKSKDISDGKKNYQKEADKTGDTNGQVNDHSNSSQISAPDDEKEEETSKTEEPKKRMVDKVSTLNSTSVDNDMKDNNEVIEKLTKKVDPSESNSLGENKSKSTIPDEEGADSHVKDYDSAISKTTVAVKKETKESKKPVETSRETKMESNQFEFSSSSEGGTNISQKERVVHEHSTSLSGVNNQEDSSKEMSNSNKISVSEENIDEYDNDIIKKEYTADQFGDTSQEAMQSGIASNIDNNQNKDTNENSDTFIAAEKENIKKEYTSSLEKSIRGEVSVPETKEEDVDSHKTNNSTEISVKNVDGEEESTEIGRDSSGASKEHEIHELSSEDNMKTVGAKETLSINEINKNSIEKEKQAPTSIEGFSTRSSIDSNTAETEDHKVNLFSNPETQNIKTGDKKEMNENSVLPNSTSTDDIQSPIGRSISKERDAGDSQQKSARTEDQTEETTRDSSVIEHSLVATMEKCTPRIKRQLAKTDDSTDFDSDSKNPLVEKIIDESQSKNDTTGNVFDARDNESMDVNSPPESRDEISANEEPFVKKTVTPLGDQKPIEENVGSSSDSTKKEMNVENVSPNGNIDENKTPLDEMKKSSMDYEQSLVDTKSVMSQDEQSESGKSEPKSSGIVERVAKNYVNYVIDKEKNAVPENKNPDDENETDASIHQEITSKAVQSSEDSDVKGSFDSSKLREELQKVEEESKFTTFKPAFNPSQSRQEIENASLHKTLPNETGVHHNLSEAAAVLKIQSMWRGFKVRRNVRKPNIIQLEEDNSNVLKKNNQEVPVAHEAPDNILQAVTMIQRLWRGYKTRRDLRKMQFNGKRVSGGNNYADAMLAAVSIQKMWRGFKTRNLLNMQHKSNGIESVRRPISKDYTDSANTGTFNEPTKDHHRATIDETMEHPEMNTLLDEILDYPVREEHHLIDTYQNKLLDKISGKTDDSNEDLEVYKALTSKRIEELKSEEERDLSGVHASLLSKPHGVKPKLESLAEEPSEDKLYTFSSAPSPIPCDPKIVPESVDAIATKTDTTKKPIRHSTSESQLSKHPEVDSKPPVRSISLDARNKDTAGLLHSGELHDSLVLPLSKGLTGSLKPDGDGTVSVAAKGEDGVAKMLSNAALLHTGELHDSIVLPLTIGKGRVGEVSRGSSSATVPVVSVNFENNAVPVGVQILQAPAALGAVTAARASPAQAREAAAPPAIPSGAVSASRRPSMGSDEGDEKATQRGVSMETEAARKIQAGFRGYQVRKQLKLKNGSSDMSMSNSRRQPRPKMSLKESPKSQSKPKEIEEKSAVKIQAGVRGFLVRRRQKKQNNQ